MASLDQLFFFGDYGDSLEIRTTTMIKKIKTRRFMVSGEDVVLDFPDDSDDKELGNEKCPRVYMFPN